MKYKIINYNPKLKEKAKQLRKNSTVVEKLLWIGLRKKQMLGYDFGRQKPIGDGDYIVDFYCKELKLAIEIDGQSHEGKYEYDEIREINLNNLGVKILRFKDEDIKKDTDNVLIYIEDFIRLKSTPPFGPPPDRGNSNLELLFI